MPPRRILPSRHTRADIITYSDTATVPTKVLAVSSNQVIGKDNILRDDEGKGNDDEKNIDEVSKVQYDVSCEEMFRVRSIIICSYLFRILISSTDQRSSRDSSEWERGPSKN